MEFFLAVCVLLLGLTSPGSALTVVDLTYEMGNDSLTWPTNPKFKFTILFRNFTADGLWLESNAFSTPEHIGTHADAPAHFFKSSWRAAEIPVSHLVGPAVVIDVKAKAADNPDYELSVKDVLDWEKSHGRLPPKSIVLMNSGWGSRYPNATLVFNTENTDDPTTFRFPGIHPDTATFLTTQREVIAVGLDTPSTDRGKNTKFPTHFILSKNNIIGLENLANLDSLPSEGATVVIGLIKLRDGSGGPIRMLGILGNMVSSSGYCCHANAGVWTVSFLLLSCFFTKRLC